MDLRVRARASFCEKAGKVEKMIYGKLGIMEKVRQWVCVRARASFCEKAGKMEKSLWESLN